MLTMKSWLRVVVSGLLLTGCGGGMDSMAGEGQQGDTHASATTIPTTPPTTPPSTPPATVTLPVRDMRALWPTTASKRRYVVLVAYTVPPDAITGYIAPPRFRAFGMDMSTSRYVFTVDGPRSTYLGSFSEAMLLEGAVVIATPPGLKFDGSCPITAPVVALGVNGEPSVTAFEAECGTDPIVRSGGSTNTGGNDWYLNWTSLMGLADGVNVLLGATHYSGFAAQPVAMDAPEAAEAR